MRKMIASKSSEKMLKRLLDLREHRVLQETLNPKP